MSFPSFGFFSSLDELKEKCPSRKHGRTWKQELNYRKDCVQIILECAHAPYLKLPAATPHKAIVLLHRYFSRCSSTECTGLQKWAMATACLFLAIKIDSVYHRLESVAHASFRALRTMQQREPEREYYNADGSPGNPAFLANLAAMVREAEAQLIFAINFDFNVGVSSSMVVYQLDELGLTVEHAGSEQAVMQRVRRLAYQFAINSITAPRSVVCLLYSAREAALGCISKACRVHGVQLDLSRVDGKHHVPLLSQERLAAIESMLPKIVGNSAADSAATGGGNGAMDGSSNGMLQQQGQEQGRAVTEAAAADGCGTPGSCFPGYGNAAAAAAAGVKQGQYVGGVSVGDGSASEAATAGPRMNPSPISPDSQTGPAPAAFGAAAGSCGRPKQQQQQQQQQCRKRAREEGFASGLLVAQESSVQKQGGMVAA